MYYRGSRRHFIRSQCIRRNLLFLTPPTRDANFQYAIGLVQSKPWNKFANSFEGLPALIDMLLQKFHVSTTRSNTSIPASCFSYYIWQHLYARIVKIKSLRQTLTLTEDERRYESYIDRKAEKILECALPDIINDYLLSIGDIQDVTQAEFILDFPVWPNEKGHFGRVSKDTHYKYETMAAPIVLAQRIMHDLAYSKKGGENIWNLPDDLVPVEKNAGLPTRNLLGWDFSRKLSDQEIELIESAGITSEKFSTTLPRFMWNDTLFYRIHYCLIQKYSASTISYIGGFTEETKSQIPWVYRDEYARFSRSQKYIDGSLKLNVCYELNPVRTYKASAFCFRVRKDRIGLLDSYCCYDFNFYKEVPVSWIRTRNTVFNHGDVGVWNVSSFEKSITNFDSILSIMQDEEEPLFEIMYDIPAIKNFTITFEGLSGLIDETYNMLCSGPLYKSIAKSVFSYYIWMHLYANVAQQRRSYYTGDDHFISLMRKLSLPQPIIEYLFSIGNVDGDELGLDCQIHFPVWPNQEGHFGRITGDTHYKYEALAAPAVLAQRIMEDLAYTENSDGSKIWNIRLISPDESNAGFPTKNLLGWDLSERLNESQQRLLRVAGITVRYFNNQNSRYMLNERLVKSVGNIFKHYNLKQDITEAGSPSQYFWQKRDGREEVFHRLIQYCERPMRQMSFVFKDSLTVFESLLYSFRVRKDSIGNLDSYCCYDFNGYTEVPDDWKETRNTLFEYGNTDLLNKSNFNSVLTVKEPFRRNWIKRQIL